MNQIILQGYVGADPEIRQISEGSTVVNARMATNKKYRDRHGNLHENTQWHSLVVWNSQEHFTRLVKKGSSLLVRGTMEYRKGKDGSIWPQVNVDEWHLTSKPVSHDE